VIFVAWAFLQGTENLLSATLPLPSEHFRVMDVMHAVDAQGNKPMKYFTIDTDNNTTIHNSKKAARETGAGVFSTEEQLNELIGQDTKRLVEIWNSITGVRPVTKFASRKNGVARIWAAIQQLGGGRKPAPEAQAITPATPFDAVEETPAGPESATVSAQAPEVAPTAAEATTASTGTKKARKAKKAAATPEAVAPRKGSKTAQVVAMLQTKAGATLDEIMQKMGWQRHTVRGFMAGAMKKAGYAVESFKPEGGERTYRINK